MPRKPDPGSPFEGVGEYSVDDVSAIQALIGGQPVPAHIARHAFNYIVNTLAATYDQSYRPERPHDSAFVEGRRFVGLQLVKLSKLNLQQLKVSHARRNTGGRDPGRDPASESSPRRPAE